jgi:hypothetical protein
MRRLTDDIQNTNDFAPLPFETSDVTVRAAPIREGWARVTKVVHQGRSSPGLIRAIESLRRLDPDFSAADFLTAVAWMNRGDYFRARPYLVAQLSHPSGDLAREAMLLLASVDRRVVRSDREATTMRVVC